MRFKRLLVTGGAGFIGSAFIRRMANVECLVNLDALTYAGNLDNVAPVASDPRYTFVHGDINDANLLEEIIEEHAIDCIVHFAAESHVDRSIDDPRIFFRTNLDGTLTLLEGARRHRLHFHHVSTDEVYGSIEEGAFTEESPYDPSSPYSASKAASDHAVRAYGRTFDLSYTLSNCTNNYGPCQFPEKFIPVMIEKCLAKEPFPVYGKGTNVRDWLFVDDHVDAIWLILEKGKMGESYNIGGKCELKNLDLLYLLIDRFSLAFGGDPKELRSLITFVDDRPGHDMRYALSIEKIQRELHWHPQTPIEIGLDLTLAHAKNRLHHSR